MAEDFVPPRHAMNSLATAASSYLRSAMHQPVQWQQWGEAAFAKAAAEDKPVLLDIGAVWCHWCHVMDRESYEDAGTAALINDYFVAVKVDRDERPDVDARYQAAVQAISGQGGWPLTAFLTPAGLPYFGGTYFPPEERYGRPSFQRVLKMMAQSFYERRDEVDESAQSVMDAITQSELFTGAADSLAGAAGPALIDKLVSAVVGQYDNRNGGFGSQPKFPHAAALDLLTDTAARGGPNAEEAAEAVLGTLKKMWRGGICDQLAGGFHRYSVDERWVVPHFEKMAYDNSELLRSYVHAFQTFSDPELAEAAISTMQWMSGTLSNRELGGFYASQDADLSLEDDGDYFTWTHTEATSVLTADEMQTAEMYFDIGPVGDMQHDPARNVLFRPFTTEQISLSTGIEITQVAQLVESARAKLLAARERRATPFVDRTMYTGWNGMCISAYFEAGRVLGRPDAVAFAQTSLDRVLSAALHDGSVSHVIAYADGAAVAESVAGVLDDYVFLGTACMHAWEVTGEIRYFAAAEEIAETLLSSFADDAGGGFFDTAEIGSMRLGALAARRKPLQDAPTPAGNPAAALLLLRLYALNGDERYRISAEKTLECFAGVAEHLGLYAGTYGLALGRLARPSVQVVIVGDGAEARAMEAVALAGYSVSRMVVRLRRDQVGSLPPELESTVPGLMELHGDRAGAVALVCSEGACEPPVFRARDLPAALQAVLTR